MVLFFLRYYSLDSHGLDGSRCRRFTPAESRTHGAVRQTATPDIFKNSNFSSVCQCVADDAADHMN
jgi:hypothetical protein